MFVILYKYDSISRKHKKTILFRRSCQNFKVIIVSYYEDTAVGLLTLIFWGW